MLMSGAAGVRALFHPLRRWRVGFGWYAFAVLFPVAHWAAALGLDRLLGRTYPLGSSPALTALGPQAAAMLPILVVFAFPNALGEELGWRGFALPKLQTRYSALVASTILGLFWGLWHVPMWIAQQQADASALPVLWMVVSIVPAAILFTWLYNNTNGSLLPVWLFHAAIAITNYFTPALPSHTHAILSWVVAMVVVAVTGPARLVRRPAQVPLEQG
jgi:membrane protease YdiL (CAAX protease family)